MTTTDSPIARASWLSRTPDFGMLRDAHLRDGSAFVVMQYRNPGDRTTSLWFRVPAHRHLLEPLAADRDWVDLRYAAIDWKALPAEGTRTAKLVWALELAQVLEHVARSCAPSDLGWLACPFVKIDLAQHARIGFGPIVNERLPPETLRHWPHCDERGLVFVVGKLLSEWTRSPDRELAAIIARCVTKPRRRYPTLVALQRALVAAGALRAFESSDRVWAHVELAVGLVLHGWPASAREHLEFAREHVLARSLIAELDREAAARSVQPAASSLGSVTRPRDPESPEALAVRARALLAAHKATEALSCAQALTALVPGGREYYLRGRCLFALSRFAEARDAFELACTLSPVLLEAMLLRREAERALANVRNAVGTPSAIAIELPPHLAPLAAVIARGDVEAAIAILERDHARDAAAQLVLANCFAFGRRNSDAIAAFERAEQLDHGCARPARIGKGFALLDLDRADEALALFDGYPADLNALEGRARALDRLGRRVEAERVLDKLVSSNQR